MTPRIFIFSIVLVAEYLFYVNSNATYAPTFFGYIISVLASVQTEEMNIFYDIFRRDMKGEPISSGYLSDHETKLQDMVQQLSVESQDSRFCYLTSSEVSFTIGNLIMQLSTSLKEILN